MSSTLRLCTPSVRSRTASSIQPLATLSPSHYAASRTNRRQFRTTTTCSNERDLMYARPTPSHVNFKGSSRFENLSDSAAMYMPRNPLNYLEVERRLSRRNQILRKRIFIGLGTIAALVAIQGFIVFAFQDDVEGEQKNKAKSKEHLDAMPGLQGANSQVVVMEKPGQPEIKLNEHGVELVETGTSSIPHFPRKIQLPSSSPDPASTPTSAIPGKGAQEGYEEYTLLGLGIRTVSFLSVQVYVLGLYVRTADLDTLQAAFVKHVNPGGSSLIPSEKEALKTDLMSADASLDIWGDVLREAHIRSCIRIVPTRGTDFNHLRDGWVRGITARTQDFGKRGVSTADEYGTESFGQAMAEFKALMSGRGSAPKGSTVLLTRDEEGVFGLLFDPVRGKGAGEINSPDAIKHGSQVMGRLADERISRQVWLGYLGGSKVSSEGARKSIVDGVMELVERPIGTVSSQVL